MNLKYSKAVAFIILFIGLVLRLYCQFINWTFNGDEINLARNIINRSYDQLLYPLDYGQSAPPLFLILQKAVFIDGHPEFSLKILNFILSALGLFLFFEVVRRCKYSIGYLSALAFMCCSPFVIYNTLTLKQYSFDLTLGIFSILLFTKTNKWKQLIFFIIFCLVSNVASFFCAGILIWKIIKQCRFPLIFETKLVYSYLPYLTAPIPYVIFFVWFINQEGASQLQSYMMQYWQNSFLPLNGEFFIWTFYMLHGLILYIFSSYLVIGVLMATISILGSGVILRNFFIKKNTDFINDFVGIYASTLAIHLFLSALKLYPFSDRLYVYLAPVFYVLLAEGLDLLVATKKYKILVNRVLVLLIPLFIISLLLSYFPYQDNDINQLTKVVNNKKGKIYITNKAMSAIKTWQTVMADYKTGEVLKNSTYLPQKNFAYNSLIVSRQQIKYGHDNRYSSPEPEIQSLLESNLIEVEEKLNGFVIYKPKAE
tara:strand:- start:30195 stop:31643 length:1449 start_codon:yes stop_codon:yes gene_type:complete